MIRVMRAAVLKISGSARPGWVSTEVIVIGLPRSQHVLICRLQAKAESQSREISAVLEGLIESLAAKRK
jgi:hypothetical protein